jgi:hypothetical protein
MGDWLDIIWWWRNRLSDGVVVEVAVVLSKRLMALLDWGQ